MFCWYNDDNQVLKGTLTLDCHHCTNKTYLSKKEMERARQKEKGLSNAKFSTFQYFKANTSFFLLRKEAFKLNMVMKDIIFKWDGQDYLHISFSQGTLSSPPTGEHGFSCLPMRAIHIVNGLFNYPRLNQLPWAKVQRNDDNNSMTCTRIPYELLTWRHSNKTTVLHMLN